MRDRLGSEPVLLPSGRLAGRDDARLAARLRAGAPTPSRTSGRTPSGPTFARPGALPTFDPNDVDGSYGEDRQASTPALLGKFRFARGVLTQSNFGLVRFELDDDGGVIACQDLYTHPPGKHEGVHVNTYRVALERFGDERPKLTF